MASIAKIIQVPDPSIDPMLYTFDVAQKAIALHKHCWPHEEVSYSLTQINRPVAA
jgi:hypothetical protein